MKAVAIGILSSFFFAVTFVLNRLMSSDGGSWIWSASLRYLFMLPLLLLIVGSRRNLRPLLGEIRIHPWSWLWWSFVGFGLFYAPLCFAAAYSPAWLVAGTWQFTIVAGSLVAPLVYETVRTGDIVMKVRPSIPLSGMGMSLIILAGIAIMELSRAGHVSPRGLVLGIVPILVAAFAYPLGNRKMMALCGDRLDAWQRTLGMTIASLPLWVILSVYQWISHGLPAPGQVLQSFIVALFSGVIATVLFFTATDLARHNLHHLAAVEATQSGEVVFTLFGERLLLPDTTTSALGYVGVALVVIGMVLHSLVSARPSRRPPRIEQTDAASERSV
ncbi:multidrug resistance efflux transporter family protein [Alicyclobacillus cycloheptanicus]|uniref:Drug/metabolite transporter (DMT)-like permease n=1 Tax=Alicyclobacillus cycloheptanicus TaxID=1457 RepID=A0ABT9XKS2_9BACL|nr:multidrug resistance efflux transporter family protein [Alicyclobacillus cycloheptanicus]MDQ0190802.1 drug/metabolite transporter (DMT)-like permease [Alicyclobacillus cycloheptanicus]WDM02716.1 multidrug resistance efflux transporter family protein [Alicyclobacillus cycloheptanicus]